VPRVTSDCFGFRVFPRNVPLNRAGVYRITCLINGKCYIGTSSQLRSRIRSHANDGSPRRLRNAIRKHGKYNFLVEPLYYLVFGDNQFLLQIEADLIVEHDSIKHGYNVLAMSDGIGPYGKEFSALLKKAHQRPEVRARVLAANTSAEHRKKQSEALIRFCAEHPEFASSKSKMWKRLWSDPEMRARLTSLRNDPTYNSKRSVAIKRGMSTPEAKAKAAAFLADTKAQERRARAISVALSKSEKWAAEAARRRSPEGRAKNAERGRKQFATKASRKRAAERQASIADKHSAALKEAWKKRPRIWITNGVDTCTVSAFEPIPNGWHRGRSNGHPHSLTV
jgi:group I intron endonuclease